MGHKTYMNRKRRDAFTLTEILVSILILGLIMGAVIGLFFAIVMHLQQSNDITTAQQRGEMVLTALGPKILAAGLGMPQTASFDLLGWESAVVSGDTDKELTIVYAVPTDAIVSGEKSFAQDAIVSVDLINFNSIPPNAIKNDNTDVAGWVVFPATGVFMEAIDINNPIRLKAATLAGKVYTNDRLHLVRAIRAEVDNEKWFVMTDLKPDTARQIVEGIADIRFEKSTDGKFLRVWVLARGNTRHDTEITPVPDWHEPIDTENRHYRLKVVQRTWGLRNR